MSMTNEGGENRAEGHSTAESTLYFPNDDGGPIGDTPSPPLPGDKPPAGDVVPIGDEFPTGDEGPDRGRSDMGQNGDEGRENDNLGDCGLTFSFEGFLSFCGERSLSLEGDDALERGFLFHSHQQIPLLLLLLRRPLEVPSFSTSFADKSLPRFESFL